MRKSMLNNLLRFSLLTLLLLSPGCEVGRSWFSMNSDSPMPWLGIDLMPRRKKRTTQVLPRPGTQQDATRFVSSRSSRPQGESRRPGSGRFFKELHLPSIPAYFDGQRDEELSFEGPEGPFSR